MERMRKILKEVLGRRCSELSEEERDGKVLFFCNEELVGSVVLLGNILAATVYSLKVSDPIHKEFLSEVEREFKDSVLEKGTKLSTGVEQNFYYTYVHVKL